MRVTKYDAICTIPQTDLVYIIHICLCAILIMHARHILTCIGITHTHTHTCTWLVSNSFSIIDIRARYEQNTSQILDLIVYERERKRERDVWKNKWAKKKTLIQPYLSFLISIAELTQVSVGGHSVTLCLSMCLNHPQSTIHNHHRLSIVRDKRNEIRAISGRTAAGWQALL